MFNVVHPFHPNSKSELNHLMLVSIRYANDANNTLNRNDRDNDKCMRTKYIFLLTVRCSPNTFCGCSLLNMVWQQVNFPKLWVDLKKPIRMVQ